MNSFVWILTADKNASFGKSGVSGSYIIPQGDMKVSPKSLSGHRLWILLRGKEDRILLSIKIKKIDRITEGYYDGDFLASVDLLSSFRLVSSYSEAVKYIVKNTKIFSTGIYEISKDDDNSLSQIVIKSVEVKLAKPNIKNNSGLNTKILPRSGQYLAKAAIRMIVSHFNLNEVWAAGSGKKLSAFSNFANEIIVRETTSKGTTTTSIENLLKSFDPLVNLFEQPNNTYSISRITSSPKVDIDFSEIDPKKIYAREFISLGDQFIDLEASLNKTEHAEKVHQEMLKDISKFLISKGITPYESGSIDLIFMSTNKIKVCEIKSATSDNIFAQSAKGAFQLSCYLEELTKQYDNATPHLILKKVGDEDFELYVKKVLSRLGIEALYYDPEHLWPHRLRSLLE